MMPLRKTSRRSMSRELDLLKNPFLEFPLDLLTVLIRGALAVQVQQGAEVELGRLE